MASNRTSFLENLIYCPWWVGVGLAIVTYVISNWIIPNIEFKNLMYKGFAQAAPMAGKIFALLFFVAGLFSALLSGLKRRQLDKQTGINSIRALSWKQFEELVGEAYRRKGYQVIENPTSGPDGGVDLKLKKDGEVTLVQCKQWLSTKVGVKIVRELYGVMTAKKANGGIIVTCGEFTPEAMDFAASTNIELINGMWLIALIESAQKCTKIVPAAKANGKPLCPKCGIEMVQRTARKGTNSGNQFWGCPSYPNCRGTRPFTGNFAQ